MKEWVSQFTTVPQGEGPEEKGEHISIVLPGFKPYGWLRQYRNRIATVALNIVLKSFVRNLFVDFFRSNYPIHYLCVQCQAPMSYIEYIDRYTIDSLPFAN